jgi:cell division protein ZapA (FtsZ GTPase activity inhibitor)
VSQGERRTLVSVHIADEEYTIRTDESDAYTRECASYVDQTVRDILKGSSTLAPHKASVLAALAITDQLFRAQREASELREEAARRASGLSSEIARRLEGPGLATRS